MSTPRVLAITGVTKGLGNAMARVFLSQGHTVIGCGRSEDKLHSLKDEFLSSSDRIHLSVVDVSKDDQVKSWCIDAIQKHGAPDIVINNVGVANIFAPLWEITPQEFNTVIDTSLKSYASVMRYFIPDMLKSGRGVIINLTSMFGTQPFGYLAPYTAAKHAVEGLSNALAQELPDPLCSVIIDPGVVQTNMSDYSLPAEIARKLVTAEEWAQKVCPFILTVDRPMNGQTLVVPEMLKIECGCKIKEGTIIFQGIDY